MYQQMNHLSCLMVTNIDKQHNRILCRKRWCTGQLVSMKLKTFASIAVSRDISSTKRKTKELIAEHNLFGQLMLLSIAHHINLEKVFEYPLGPVPWSLAMIKLMRINFKFEAPILQIQIIMYIIYSNLMRPNGNVNTLSQYVTQDKIVAT